MNTLSKLLLCGLATVSAGLHAEGEKRDHHHHKRKGPPPLAMMRVLDKDGDHILSATEIASASAALLSLDANKDGKLEPSEFIGHPPKPMDEDDVMMPAPPPAPPR